MADVRLAVATRTDLGSGNSGRLRKAGKIPGVVYGPKNDPIAVAVDARELRAALSGDAGLNALLDLDLDGTSHAALAREIQRHPTRGTVQHVDFQIVRLDQAITVDVPVELTGEADKVTGAGGQVVLDVANLTVNATPRTIPQVIEIDITHLELGNVIRLSEITFPEGVTCDIDGDTVVVTGLAPRTAAAQAAMESGEPIETDGEGGEGGEGGESADAEGGDAEAGEGDAPAEASE